MIYFKHIILVDVCVAPSIRIPIKHNLCCMLCRVSMSVFVTITSVLKVRISKVDCFFEYQLLSVVMRYIWRNQVWDLHVCLSPAWSLCTNMWRSTSNLTWNSLQLHLGIWVLSFLGYFGSTHNLEFWYKDKHEISWRAASKCHWGINHVWQQHRYFCQYVDSALFYHPPKYSQERLIVWCMLGQQFSDTSSSGCVKHFNLQTLNMFPSMYFLQFCTVSSIQLDGLRQHVHKPF